jgi:excisionase family DNA binding protein
MEHILTHPSASDPWETLHQAAERVQVHEATLRRLIRAGLLRHARVASDRNIRVRMSWVDAALERRLETA